MQTVRTVKDLRACIKAWRTDGLSVGLVPTMGALHAGHLSLVQAAAETCDRVIVTLFVNPTQFGAGDDFEAYPRSEDADRDLAAGAGAHLLFAPGVEDMYPQGAATTVSVSGLSEVLEGAHRLGHFDGVATIVTKLLLQSLPDRAFFGQKDYQQLQVIRQLTRDLDIGVAIIGVPTVREADGLALSSRNAYLNAEERALAPRLHATLVRVAQDFKTGADAAILAERAVQSLQSAGFGPVDYVAICDAATLEPLQAYDPARRSRVLAAAKLGRARLIDNVSVDEG